MGVRPPSPLSLSLSLQIPKAQKHHHVHLFLPSRTQAASRGNHHHRPSQPTDREEIDQIRDSSEIMKHPRTEQEAAGEVSLALSLSTTDSSTTSDSTGTPSSGAAKRARRRGAVVATSGEGEFVCKTCSRAFTSFQALRGHRTSHLRGRHGLELGVGARALKQHKQAAAAAAGGNNGSGGDKAQPRQQHECHICGLGFEMGQALGGHMRRHREEMGAAEAADAWVWRTGEAPRAAAAADTPVLLELFA